MPRNVYFVVRTNTEPATLVISVRTIVNQLDSRAAVQSVSTLEQVVSNSIAGPRFYALLLGIFGGVALALASVGIYGIIAYSVTQRTREIGIRMALGANSGTVLGLVLRQGFVLAGIGLAIGIGGAVGATRYLKSMLYGLTPLDSMTFAYVIVLFAAISLFASYVPARRATKVDPLAALRDE
jgi:putative ABC transport system permease protein